MFLRDFLGEYPQSDLFLAWLVVLIRTLPYTLRNGEKVDLSWTYYTTYYYFSFFVITWQGSGILVKGEHRPTMTLFFVILQTAGSVVGSFPYYVYGHFHDYQ